MRRWEDDEMRCRNHGRKGDWRGTWQEMEGRRRFMGGAKAARDGGAENCPMRQPPDVVGQDHHFRRRASPRNFYFILLLVYLYIILF